MRGPEVRLWLLSIVPKAVTADLPHHRTVYRERVISIGTGRQHGISVCGGVKSRLIATLQRFPSPQFSSE